MRGSFPISLDIPVIETERLKMRGHSIEDASKVTALWSNPEVTRYIGGKQLTAEESKWERLAQAIAKVMKRRPEEV